MRPKGVPNKPKRRLLARIQADFPDYHPVIEMVKVAIDEDADKHDRFNANKEVAKYIEPALKAIEVKSEVDGELKVTIQRLTDA